MKYMGSKRWMLRNGLGLLIRRELKTASRFVDLFSGSGAVARFAALGEDPVEVCAYDIQSFSAILAEAVIGRTKQIDSTKIWDPWLERARCLLVADRKFAATTERMPGLRAGFTRDYVDHVRRCCAKDSARPITRAYGGYYFSRPQALWLDALRTTVPSGKANQAVALAALIQAASQCSASPGHTAQPFRASKGAKRFLFEAWQHDIVAKVREALVRLSSEHAKKMGRARVLDANTAAKLVRKGDLVFLDPPYSGVHYSRFYHVLETLARGECGEVSGSGRYPPSSERPRSRYSVSSEAMDALEGLLAKLAEKKAKAILTFPQRQCSNGLSGRRVHEVASKYFKVESTFKRSRFSTLGGTIDADGIGYGRKARQKTHELILTLTPK